MAKFGKKELYAKCYCVVQIQSFTEINSTYGADASVLVLDESAQITYMHCYKYQTPADTMYL